MKKLLVIGLLMLGVLVQAQTGTVAYDYPASTPPATVQGYAATLFVNGTAFPITDTCVLNTTVTPNVVTCTAPLPNITAALTSSGPQSFTVTLKNVVLESSPSAPFVLTAPSAPTGIRIQ